MLFALALSTQTIPCVNVQFVMARHHDQRDVSFGSNLMEPLSWSGEKELRLVQTGSGAGCEEPLALVARLLRLSSAPQGRVKEKPWRIGFVRWLDFDSGVPWTERLSRRKVDLTYLQRRASRISRMGIPDDSACAVVQGKDAIESGLRGEKSRQKLWWRRTWAWTTRAFALWSHGRSACPTGRGWFTRPWRWRRSWRRLPVFSIEDSPQSVTSSIRARRSRRTTMRRPTSHRTWTLYRRR